MLGIFLPKSQGDGLGEAGLVAQVQERGGVTGGVRPAKRADDSLVRGGFNIPPKEMIGQPQDGVKPVEAEGDIGQGFRQVVSAADVGLLVQENIAPVGFRQADGEIDAGPEKSADKGAVDLDMLPIE